METRERRSLGDDAGYIVGIAMLIILFVNAGAGAVVVKVAEKGGVKADHADYLEFGRLYLSTFLLSLTLTVAVAVFAVARIYGFAMHWAVPVGVVILGGYLTGLPVHVPSAAQTHNPKVWLAAWLVGALRAFARYYRTAFFGGTVVGLAGGLLLVAAVHHHRGPVEAAVSGTTPRPVGGKADANRPPQRWAAQVTVLIVAIVAAAYVISVSPGLAGAAVPTPRPTVVATPTAGRPTRPAPTARFTKVTWGSTNSQRRAPYHLEITFTGLRGENCRITWQTVYISTNAQGDTSGEVWTGALAYDDGNWWIDSLMVTAPSGAQRWGTYFSAYCRGVLMASR